MEKYTEAELQVVAFEAEDVITGSYDPENGYENL
jgi:hypothetical protein